jgi:hypothetical protein
MLMLTGMCSESTQQGQRYALLFVSPRIPGMHYKVETDAGTVRRLQEVIGAEIGAMHEVPEADDAEDDFRGPRQLFG